MTKKKADTALAIVSAQQEILIHEIAERGCWRTKFGSRDCNQQNQKAAGGYDSWACAACRAQRYLKGRKKG